MTNANAYERVYQEKMVALVDELLAPASIATRGKLLG